MNSIQEICFNPYFNGSSTSTGLSVSLAEIPSSCFNPYFNGSSTSTFSNLFNPFSLKLVSILINGSSTSTKKWEIIYLPLD